VLQCKFGKAVAVAMKEGRGQKQQRVAGPGIRCLQRSKRFF
jgi:hypothetical protein